MKHFESKQLSGINPGEAAATSHDVTPIRRLDRTAESACESHPKSRDESLAALSSAPNSPLNQDWLATNAPRILGESAWEELPLTVSTKVEAPDASWPWGLIMGGTLVLLLLAAAGYVLAREYATQREEIITLRAALATAFTAEDVARREQTAVELRSMLDDLSNENSDLQEQVQELHRRLAVRDLYAGDVKSPQNGPSDSIPPVPAASDMPASANTSWFVNFGSYYKPGIAKEWSERLNPAAGEIAISTAGPEDGKLYRVRIVGLATRQQAEQLARQLEKEYDLERLWVGKR